MEKVEQAVGLVAGLKHRVEEAEKAVGDGNLRSVVREVASGIVADRAPGLAQAVLPALGWTGPPSIAAIFAMKLAGGILRRRRSKRKQRVSPDADRPSREPLSSRTGLGGHRFRGNGELSFPGVARIQDHLGRFTLEEAV